MIIALTGVPGTGKSVLANYIGKKLVNWEIVDLNKLAKTKNLYMGFDKERGSKIVDIKQINLQIKKIKRNVIMQSHYAHLLDNNLTIILKTDPAVLRRRLEKRKWSREKIQENIDAEIMEVIKSEVKKPFVELDTAKEGLGNLFTQTMHAIAANTDLILPKELTPIFKKQYGRIVKKAKGGKIIAIGDATAYNLLKAGIKPEFIIFDNKEKRKPFKHKLGLKPDFVAENQPSYLTPTLWKAIERAASLNKAIIKVIGEEDLAVLPSVILFPIGYRIYYGQPDVGLVEIRITKTKKRDANGILTNFIDLQPYRSNAFFV